MIIVGVGVGVGLHEWTYRTVTGMDFWPSNASTQTGFSIGSVQPIEKLTNLAWHTARVIVFAAPWSLALLAWRRTRRSDAPSDRRILPWLVISAAALIVTMALFDRRADRYVFPAYPLVAMAGGGLIWESSPRVRSVVDRWSARMPYLFAADAAARGRRQGHRRHPFLHPDSVLALARTLAAAREPPSD